MISPRPLISVDRLGKSYAGSPVVLSDISLKIDEGETVALIGANGAGKSTLLKCLVGLHEISTGSITALDQTFGKLPASSQKAAIRRQIGFVFQQHGLVRRLSALSNVVHGFLGRPGSWRAWSQSIAPEAWRRAALESLEAVRLRHKAGDRVDQLSGGQAQRVAIARALVRKPRLFIADEPAASLDPASGHDVMTQFVSLVKDNGFTLIFTSHDMEHAAGYADRIVALKGGRIFFDKPSGAVGDDELKAVFHD